MKTRSVAHEVLQALNNPPNGELRFERTYSESMRPLEFTIDIKGLTDVYTFQSLRNELDD